MFESGPKKKRLSSDREIDERLAGYLEELHSTQDSWFREGSFENINSRMKLIGRALEETRKILVVDDHRWGEREYHASSASMALSEEYNRISYIKEGFAQKQEIEKQKEMPTYFMAGAQNPYQTEPVAVVAKANTGWDFLK